MEIGKLVKQGAEARIYEGNYLGRRVLCKERFPKSYRIPELDRKLTRERIREEVRAISRIQKLGIDVPCLYHIHTANTIVMEYVEGVTAKEFIDTNLLNSNSSTERQWFIDNVASTLARLHDANMIHGDLTTSNMLIRMPSQTTRDIKIEPLSLVLIDFGLSQVSALAESRAVDLYVLERAFQSTHPGQSDLFEAILSRYYEISARAKETRRKFEEVRLRGRKRDMAG